MPLPKHRPLPVTIAMGMPVVNIEDNPLARVVGLTQAYCLYRLADADTLCVASWQELALANVRPIGAMLPDDVLENDKLNVAAAVLRELESLNRLGELTAAQSAVQRELIEKLCSRAPSATRAK